MQSVAVFYHQINVEKYFVSFRPCEACFGRLVVRHFYQCVKTEMFLLLSMLVCTIIRITLLSQVSKYWITIVVQEPQSIKIKPLVNQSLTNRKSSQK
jgi:hypothetical protein